MADSGSRKERRRQKKLAKKSGGSQAADVIGRVVVALEDF